MISQHRSTLGVATFGALALAFATTACAPDPPPLREEKAELTSKLTGCELLAGAAGASATVAVAGASATGTCATGAAAATVASGGVAAPGALVCLIPAGGTVLATITGLLAAGATYLVCGAVESVLESRANDDGETRAPATPAQNTAQCEGKNPKNVSAESAGECPGEDQTSRLDVVYCSEAFEGGTFDYVHPDGSKWNCGGKSPHYPCLPSVENNGDATHRHYYRTRYNFSASKGCCFYQETEERVTCGSQNDS